MMEFNRCHCIAVAPRNLQIIPRRSTYQPGDRIQCSAEGNPEPSYQWTDLVNGTVIPGAFLVVGEDMVNGSYVFQCTASNYYNGELHEIAYNITFFIQGANAVAYSFINPLIGTLKPQSNGPLYSNTVFGTLVVDGWTISFGTARRGRCPASPLLAVPNVTAHLSTASVLKSYHSM